MKSRNISLNKTENNKQNRMSCMKRNAKYLLCFVALAGLLMPFPAAAQSCDTLLGAINNFFLSHPNQRGSSSLVSF